MTRHMTEEVRREQILEAARQAFVEAGYHPTRMDDIARRAGLSKGGVYFHFESKQVLFAALVEQEFQQSMDYLVQVHEQDVSVLEKLELLGRYYPGYASANPLSARFFIVMTEVALRDEVVAGRMAEMQYAYVQSIKTVLDDGIEAGELRPLDSEALSIFLKAIVNGLEVGIALGYDIQLGRVIPAALNALLTGILPGREDGPPLQGD